MRYFARIQYRGTEYAGWQRQPNANSVQAELEHALSTIFREEISIMGCGRTDAGVHASKFYFHFDTQFSDPQNQINRLNGFLPKDISLQKIYPVGEQAHVRFDATHRAYEYHLCMVKDPFSMELAWQVPLRGADIDLKMLDQMAALIKSYDTFFPFCKTNHDAHTLECQIFESHWEDLGNQRMVYHIAANRFLRGMVRLIVGCSMRVATGKLSFDKIKEALDQQTRIDNAYSAPAQGLFLTEVRYPLSLNLPLT